MRHAKAAIRMDGKPSTNSKDTNISVFWCPCSMLTIKSVHPQIDDSIQSPTSTRHVVDLERAQLLRIRSGVEVQNFSKEFMHQIQVLRIEKFRTGVTYSFQ